MALQYVTPDGTLIVPGAYSVVKVAPNNAGLATTGVIFLVGEADAGPSYVEEGNQLYLNSFGPDQKADIVAKYQSGQIVDAYNTVVAASADPQIPGAPSRIIPVKTNTSTKSTTSLTNYSSTTYSILNAKLGGDPGNLIAASVTAKTTESLPTTGAFILASPSASTTVNFRVNGGAVATASLTSGETPTAMVAAIDALSGVACTGGVSRGTIFNTVSVTLTHDTGYAAHITGTLSNQPQVGDIFFMPTGSAFATANEGTYVVTAVATGRVDIYKVLDAAASTVTAPTTETVTAAPADAVAYSPVTITLESGNPVAGLGKSLEIADTSTGTFSSLCFVAATSAQILQGATPASAATFNSKTGAPVVLTSPTEYSVNLNLVRQSDSTNQVISAGGDVILTMGYAGTTASAVIAGKTMTITLTGGASASLSPITINLANYKTVADLCQYLNTLSGFTAAPALASKGSVWSINLDDGTYTFATDKGGNTGRIKADGYFMALNVTNNSTLVDIVPPGVATKLDGLPQPSTSVFMTGGGRGATAQADIQGALDALQAVQGNFVVPLFSNDSSIDIADSETSVTSSYTIAAIHAATKSHCLQMSTLKRRKARQAFLAINDTFANCKNASGNTAQPRCTMLFQKPILTDAFGNLKTFKPWMLAVVAAGCQAASTYRDVTGKFLNISGLVDPVGYNNQSDSNEEDALLAGLMPAKHETSGGFTWVSDQTTYTADSNFLLNSTQGISNADVVAATCRQRMEQTFKGAATADVDANTGLSAFKTFLDDLKDSKYISASQDAPKGYLNPQVKLLNGNTFACSVEVKITGSIKFITIQFLATPVTGSASG